jgi:hypothetical protein
MLSYERTRTDGDAVVAGVLATNGRLLTRRWLLDSPSPIVHVNGRAPATNTRELAKRGEGASAGVLSVMSVADLSSRPRFGGPQKELDQVLIDCSISDVFRPLARILMARVTAKTDETKRSVRLIRPVLRRRSASRPLLSVIGHLFWLRTPRRFRTLEGTGKLDG